MNNKISTLITRFISILITVLFCSSLFIEQAISIPRNAFANRYAEIVIDANSGETLFSENENARRYPASLTKLMTIYLLFDSIKSGRMSLNTPIPISNHAAAMPPTKLGISAGQTISAENAIKAMITKSANDVAVAVGEYIGGTEENFAEIMTTQAHKLGMMNTHFANSSGLPNLHNYTTARDLATLCLSLRRSFPDLYYLFKTTSFRYNNRTVNGHNHILKNIKGVDGLKTGYTQMSGFNLATSYHSRDKNIVAVIMGWRSAGVRDARMTALLHRFIPQAKINASAIREKPRNTKLNLNVPTPIFKRSSALPALYDQDYNPISESLYISKPIVSKHKNNYSIQIGTAKTRTSANKLYKKATSVYKPLKYNHVKQITVITQKHQKLYRVRIGNFLNHSDAVRACSMLKKKHIPCFILS